MFFGRPRVRSTPIGSSLAGPSPTHPTQSRSDSALSAQLTSSISAEWDGHPTFADFKLYDVHPRMQRHLLTLLKEQQDSLVTKGILPELKDKPRKDLRKDIPKMRTKDLDLPFKRTKNSQSALQRISFLSKVKISKHSPTGTWKCDSCGHILTFLVAFDLIKFAVMDDKETVAELFLNDLPESFLKKKYPFESNTIFLLALARRMERLALLILDKGFPIDVNSPIFTMLTSKKYQANLPFRINASLFPSYFAVAISMGYEILVRYMIKLGANVNQPWNGLTPLHIACMCGEGGHPNVNIVNILLEFGADPWLGLYLEQYQNLSQLKQTTATLSEVTQLNLDQLRATGKKPDDLRRPSDSGLTKMMDEVSLLDDPLEFVFPLGSIHQRRVPQYRVKPEPIPPLPTASATTESGSSTYVTPASTHETSADKLAEWSKDKFLLPLAFACASGNKEVIVALLNRMRAIRPRRPVAVSLTGDSKNESPRISAKQLASGAVHLPDTILANPQKDVFSLLIQQDLEVVIFLLKSGVVDLMQRDHTGSTALHYAVRSNNIELVSVLVYFDSHDGQLINSRGEKGWTPLHEAISRKSFDVFRFLLKKGADPDLKNDYGDTPKDLGVKLGIDASDLEGSWFQSLSRRGSAKPSDSSTTMHANSPTSNEFLFSLDSKILKLLQSVGFADDAGGHQHSPGTGKGMRRSRTQSSNVSGSPRRTLTTDGSTSSGPGLLEEDSTLMEISSTHSSEMDKVSSAHAVSSSPLSSTRDASSGNGSAPELRALPTAQKRAGTMRPLFKAFGMGKFKKKVHPFESNADASTAANTNASGSAGNGGGGILGGTVFFSPSDQSALVTGVTAQTLAATDSATPSSPGTGIGSSMLEDVKESSPIVAARTDLTDPVQDQTIPPFVAADTVITNEMRRPEDGTVSSSGGSSGSVGTNDPSSQQP